MEIHVLKLEKLPKEEQDEAGIIRWMRFLGAKSRRKFEKMAEKDSYMEEAYEMLKHMSVDEKKRHGIRSAVKKQSGTIIHRCKG